MCRERNTIHNYWECKQVPPLWKSVWRLIEKQRITKLIITLHTDPAILFSGIDPSTVNQHIKTLPAHPLLL
jgi:hypothetical protein